MVDSRAKIAIGIVVSLTAVGLLWACASERGVQPKEVRQVVYAGGHYDIPDSSSNVTGDVIYVLEPDSLQKLDSIVFCDDSPFRMVSSQDGSTIFVELTGPIIASDRIVALDAASHSEFWSYAGGRLRAVFDSGRKLLVRTVEGSHVLLSADNAATIREIPDTLELFAGKYPNLESVVSLRGASEWQLSALNVETLEMRGRYKPRLRNGRLLDVRYARLHPDGVRVLSIGRRSSSSDSWFVIGDINTDSTLFDLALVFSQGEIAISSDGRLAAVTDPSNFMHESIKSLSVIDLNSLTLLKRFIEPEIRSPGQVRFLDDGQTLVVFPKIDDDGPVELIDLSTLAVKWTRWLPSGETSWNGKYFWPGPFDVAPAPEN